jgi:hypothetical protein
MRVPAVEVLRRRHSREAICVAAPFINGSRFADANTPVSNILLAAFDFRLERVGEFQVVFQHVA